MVSFRTAPKTYPLDTSDSQSEIRDNGDADANLLDEPRGNGSMISEENSDNGFRDSDQDPGSIKSRSGSGKRRYGTSIRKIEVKENRIGQLADSDRFMNTTLFVIVLNAMWIGVDTEWNHKSLQEGDSLPLEPWSTVVEWLFCIYFSGELAIRFIAFKHKCDCWRDRWFVFDTILVAFMIAETWVLPLISLILGGESGGGGLKNLSTLRILRLTRMVKMARSFEELRTLVKGMISAVRAVVFILLFLVLITYVFAIIFTTQLACPPGDICRETMPVCDDIPAADEYVAPCVFGDLGSSMMTLFTNGMLGDNLWYMLDVVKEVREPSESIGLYMYWLFIIFFGISALTLLNMLIGVLCDTISNTANNERRNYQVDNFKANMSDAFKKIDDDQSGNITFSEWKKIKDEQDVKRFLADDFEIDEDEVSKTMDKMETVIFSEKAAGSAASLVSSSTSENEEDIGLTHETFIKHMIELRPDRKATPLDIEMLRDLLERNHNTLKENFQQIQQGIQKKLSQKSSSCQRFAPPPPPQPPPAHSTLRIGSPVRPEGIESPSEVIVTSSSTTPWLQTVPSEVLFFQLQKWAASSERGATAAWPPPAGIKIAPEPSPGTLPPPLSAS